MPYVKGGKPGSRWASLSQDDKDFEVEYRREYMRRWRTAKKWGITLEEYDAYIPEDGLCPICRTKPEVWALDHDHSTGAIRGMLCKSCNLGIGNLGDSADNCWRAMKWLDRSQFSS